MKITVTEIEANADEIRSSNTIADGFNNLLRRVFNPTYGVYAENNEDDDVNEESREDL